MQSTETSSVTYPKSILIRRYVFLSLMVTTLITLLFIFISRRNKHPLNARPLFFSFMFFFGMLWMEVSLFLNLYYSTL
jgi:hypothetical protein